METETDTTMDRIICAVNWLGDSVMCMPAVQCLKARHPSSGIHVLVKAGLAALWELHDCVDKVIELSEGVGGTAAAVLGLKRAAVREALVFPNSFRASLIPFLARVPVRRGQPGRQRRWMLTDIVTASGGAGRSHQAWEYMAIAGLGDETTLDVPRLRLGTDVCGASAERFGLSGGDTFVGLIPGAARGPSKRWPGDGFVHVGRRLAAEDDCRLLVFGSKGEAELCGAVSSAIGSAARDLSGQTSLQEYAAVLSQCRAVVCNDSGGMHLASAVGTRVVAVFGITDPDKTGPLGAGHRVVAMEGVVRSRDIARESARAAECLRKIAPDRVYEAAASVLCGDDS